MSARVPMVLISGDTREDGGSEIKKDGIDVMPFGLNTDFEIRIMDLVLIAIVGLGLVASQMIKPVQPRIAIVNMSLLEQMYSVDMRLASEKNPSHVAKPKQFEHVVDTILADFSKSTNVTVIMGEAILGHPEDVENLTNEVYEEAMRQINVQY